MDLLDIDSHQRCFDNIVHHFGAIDVLVNNAGRSQRAEWQSVDLTVDKELFELDVFSIVNLSRMYLSHLKKTGHKGHITVTSSIAGLIGVPFSCSYVGAKHALHVRKELYICIFKGYKLLVQIDSKLIIASRFKSFILVLIINSN